MTEALQAIIAAIINDLRREPRRSDFILVA